MKQRIIQDSIVHTVTATDDFRGGKTTQFRCGGLGICTDGSIECTGGNIAKCQTVTIALSVQTGHVIVLALVQHAAFGDRAGGDDSCDLTLYQTFGGGRIGCLFTDGNFIAPVH